MPFDGTLHPDTQAAAFAPLNKKPPVWPWNPDLLQPWAGVLARRALMILPCWGGHDGVRDLVTGAAPTKVNSPTPRIGRFGPEIKFDALTDYYNYGTSTRFHAGEMSFFLYSQTPNTATVNRPVFERDFTSAAEPYYVYRLVHSGLSGARDWAPQWNQGGTRRFFVGTYTAPLNTPYTLALSIRDGAQELWADGVSRDTSSHSGTITDYGQDTRLNSSQLGIGSGSQDVVYVFYVFEGGLTDAEVKALHADPFGIIRPDPAKLLSLFFANAGESPAEADPVVLLHHMRSMSS